MSGYGDNFGFCDTSFKSQGFSFSLNDLEVASMIFLLHVLLELIDVFNAYQTCNQRQNLRQIYAGSLGQERKEIVN